MVFPCALTFFHLAFAIFESLALAWADILRFTFFKAVAGRRVAFTSQSARLKSRSCRRFIARTNGDNCMRPQAGVNMMPAEVVASTGRNHSGQPMLAYEETIGARRCPETKVVFPGIPWLARCVNSHAHRANNPGRNRQEKIRLGKGCFRLSFPKLVIGSGHLVRYSLSGDVRHEVLPNRDSQVLGLVFAERHSTQPVALGGLGVLGAAGP